MTPTPEAFDWRAAMAFGLGVLKLQPAVFWSLTPRELQAALSGHYGSGLAPGPRRTEILALMQQYPDRPADGRHDDDP